MTHALLSLFLVFSTLIPTSFTHQITHEAMVKTQTEKDTSGMRFPDIKTVSLAGDTISIPRDTQGKYTLLCFAFVQKAQSLVDTWTFPILEKYPSDEIHYYEIPMLAGGYKFVRGFIDGGMKRGVPQNLHRHVATYYGPLNKYKSDLNMPDSNTVYLFLLDKNGVIIHRDEGAANREKLSKIFSLIEP
jgi:hypothetical protein